MRQRIERAIRDLTQRNGRPPTNREIGEEVGGKSTGHIDYHLRYMREQGIINHEPRKSRGITLVHPTIPGEAPRPVRVMLAGQIAAGAPIEANEVTDEYIDLAEGLSAGSDVFALRVKGTSMIDDHIDDGDIVLVRRQATANNGDTVVALLFNGSNEAGEATLKRFYHDRSGKVRLEPRNQTLKPFLVEPHEMQIQGKVIAVLRKV
jgi:repressor LexA